MRPVAKTGQINIAVDKRMIATLDRIAKENGYSRSKFATLLFEAAFAARIGRERGEEPVDAELDEQVRLVFACAGQADAAAIAKATGVPTNRVAVILDAFKLATKGDKR